MSEQSLSQQYLNSILRYDAESGRLFWRRRSGPCAGGTMAGCLHCRGYIHVGIDKYDYKAHRVIWRMVTGSWPDQIDHIDHNRSNNRFINLREVTNTVNHRNMKRTRANTTGVTGVCWSPDLNKWRVTIQGKSIGTFDGFLDACCCRRSEETQRGFHENHGK